MKRLTKHVLCGIIGVGLVACVLPGCTKRPSDEELMKLEETRSAAESAERKLSELRRERMQLETALQDKQRELQQHEEERDVLKEKMGK